MELRPKIVDLYADLNQGLEQLSYFVTNTQKGLEHVARLTNDVTQRLRDTSEGKSTPQEPNTKYYSLELTEPQHALLLKVMGVQSDHLSQHGVTLLNMAFMYLLALFDAFTQDIFAAVLESRPEMLKSKKQLGYEVILQLATPEKIVNYMALRELNEIGYKSATEQWQYFKQRFGVDISKSSIELEKIAEMNAQRNLLAHNRGIANQIYIESLTKPLLNIGDKVSITEDTWRDHIATIRSLSKMIVDSLTAKFCNNTVVISRVPELETS